VHIHTRVSLDGTSAAFGNAARLSKPSGHTVIVCMLSTEASAQSPMLLCPSVWRFDLNMWLLIVPCAGCYSSCPVSGACIWSAAPADLLSDLFSWCGREVALKRNVAVTDVAMFQVQHLTIPYTTSVGRTSDTCRKCIAEDHARTNNSWTQLHTCLTARVAEATELLRLRRSHGSVVTLTTDSYCKLLRKSA
jgi:hypothetical protein